MKIKIDPEDRQRHKGFWKIIWENGRDHSYVYGYDHAKRAVLAHNALIDVPTENLEEGHVEMMIAEAA